MLWRRVSIHSRHFTVFRLFFLAYLPYTSSPQTFFTGADVRQVNVPSTDGEFGILPDHVPVIAALKPGVVSVFDDAGKESKFFGTSRDRGQGRRTRTKRRQHCQGKRTSKRVAHDCFEMLIRALLATSLALHLALPVRPVAHCQNRSIPPFCTTVSSGVVTVNGDSSTDIVAEEAVTIDKIDAAVRCGR